MRMATAEQLGMVRETREASAVGAPESAVRHYSPAEIAELWNLSPDCVRKVFENEPGVLVIGNAQPKRGKRSYTTLRIPQTVLDRVHRRLRKV
jgi:hypothetical protein